MVKKLRVRTLTRYTIILLLFLLFTQQLMYNNKYKDEKLIVFQTEEDKNTWIATRTLTSQTIIPVTEEEYEELRKTRTLNQTPYLLGLLIILLEGIHNRIKNKEKQI